MTTAESVRPQHRRHDSIAAQLAHPFDHSPEILLALAALLIVVAGPVMKAFAPDGVLMSAASVLVLGVGVVLAVGAAVRMVRS